jgi:hypothetical protein
LQLRGEALMWWEHFKIMQPAGHEVTWTEFKRAFKGPPHSKRTHG